MVIKENGINFLVRLLKGDGIKRKGSNIKSQEKRIVDPFAKDTMNQQLVVHSYNDYTLLLNKFPMVLVTNEFMSQCSPLTQSDFTAITNVISQVQSLVFFNCGVDSGASQSHKHIQIIPYSELENEATPLDEYLEGTSLDRNSLCQCPVYCFDHVLCHISSYTDPISLYKQYSDMLQYMSEKRDKKGKSMTSYNFLLLKEWMLLVPRIREKWNQLNVNSLGFTGSILVKNSEALNSLTSIGPLELLKHSVEKGIKKVKSTTNHFWKRKSTSDDSRPPDITDTDVAIAKIKSQKRKINEMLKKSRNECECYKTLAKEELQNNNQVFDSYMN
ncbi:ATP adenylyltransferase [Blastocystis sp. subtype 4]|uniref:ATP adenylyltransferase n=1 Tax=Blastocystis sp. subtype 4 TaxID=944170 RepID=UPI000712193E|nr:ATP adenylyltransferase [Blastocystis sp. subtype 4]KNB45282.1 ATP adenylyltransferase [Blastocystis sp. subtype 4]|eukprot:XP_014528725.1 ATP adenylyltransferase [Blastocystis sp. subtype 4]